METSHLNSLLWALVGGSISYVLNKLLDRYLTTPKLKIFCDTSSVVEPSKWFLNGIRRGSAQLSVKVVNESIYVAKGSRVYLAEFGMLDVVPEQFRLSTSIPLPWSIPENQGVVMTNRDRPNLTLWGLDEKFDLPKGLVLQVPVVGISSNSEPFNMGDFIVYDENLKDHVLVYREYDPSEYEHRVAVEMPIKFTSSCTISSDRTYRIKLVLTADNAEPYYFGVDVSFREVDGFFSIQLANRVQGTNLAFVDSSRAVARKTKQAFAYIRDKIESDRRENRLQRRSGQTPRNLLSRPL